MKLYIVRHGDSTPGVDDDIRPLSDKGRNDVIKIASFISNMNIEVAEMIQSKKLRAQETAALLVKGLNLEGKVITSDYLDPMAPLQPILDEVGQSKKDTVLVGHMPYMARLFSALITNDEARNTIVFKPGTMVCLERTTDSGWNLRWMLSPELFKDK